MLVDFLEDVSPGLIFLRLSLTHSLTCTPSVALSHSPTHSLAHLLTQSHSLTNPLALTHLLIHSFTHSIALTHYLTHPLSN